MASSSAIHNQEQIGNEIVSAEAYNEKFKERIIQWTTFYRLNIHRFIEHYLGIKLKFFQTIFLYAMNLYPTVTLVCARAVSKSFMTALIACAICILYPKSMVVVTAYTKKQASLSDNWRFKGKPLLLLFGEFGEI